jgi:hypothetical protein
LTSDAASNVSASAGPPASALGKLARAAFYVVYVLIAAEAFIRIFKPLPMFPRNVVGTSYGVRGNAPNRVYWHTSPDVHVQFRINSKGVRSDREIPYDKPPGVVRIVALGDSFGMGYEVDERDTFLANMERALKRAGVNAEVVNLSVSGFGNSEELITLRAEGFKYHPDVVLVCWHQTDLDDNQRSGLFALRDGRLVQTADSYLPGVRAREKLEKIPAYVFLDEHSQLFNFLRETATGKVKDLVLRSRSTEPPPASMPPPPGTVGVPPSELSPDEKLAVALLQRIGDESAAHGARLLVLDIPDRLARAQFASKFPRDPQGRAFGLQVVSPIPLFEAQHGALLFNEHSHWHFTPLATHLVGEQLATELLSRKLVAPAGSPPPPPGATP